MSSDVLGSRWSEKLPQRGKSLKDAQNVAGEEDLGKTPRQKGKSLESWKTRCTFGKCPTVHTGCREGFMCRSDYQLVGISGIFAVSNTVLVQDANEEEIQAYTISFSLHFSNRLTDPALCTDWWVLRVKPGPDQLLDHRDSSMD